jgi:hypothetical protein
LSKIKLGQIAKFVKMLDQQILLRFQIFECLRAAYAGPVNIHERVLRVMNVPGQNHRDPWFAELYKSVLEDTKFIYQTTEGTPFIFPGTGTGGWEVRDAAKGRLFCMEF